MANLTYTAIGIDFDEQGTPYKVGDYNTKEDAIMGIIEDLKANFDAQDLDSMQIDYEELIRFRDILRRVDMAYLTYFSNNPYNDNARYAVVY